MATVTLTQETFRGRVATGVVLVDWWAPWCPPCRAFSPIFEAASGRHPGVVFAKVNLDENQELAAAYDIRAIPALMVFSGGRLLGVHPGLVRGPALDRIVADVRWHPAPHPRLRRQEG